MNEHFIGIQISKFRKAAGLTQEELGNFDKRRRFKNPAQCGRTQTEGAG